MLSGNHVILQKGGRGSRRCGMQQFYKGHPIEISVWLEGNDWCANSYIYYQQGPQNMLVSFALPYTFETYQEAVEAGLEAARNWIDRVKPARETN